MTDYPPLGRGRYTLEQASISPRRFTKRTCSECTQVYYIKNGPGNKSLKTCSRECADIRGARVRLDNQRKIDASTKKVVIRISNEKYDELEKVARRTHNPITRLITKIIEAFQIE